MTTILRHVGVLGMKWGRRKASSRSNSNSSRSTKPKPITKKKLTAEQQKKHMSALKRKKVKQLLKEQENKQAAKRVQSHLMTGYLTLNASKWANEMATPKSPSYNEAYADWLNTG